MLNLLHVWISTILRACQCFQNNHTLSHPRSWHCRYRESYRCGSCVAGASSELAPTDPLSEVILKVILPARQLHDYDNTVPDYLNNHQDVQLLIDSPTQWPLLRELCEFACRPPQARAPILTMRSSKRRKFVAGTTHPFLC
jgi:hypothetical protein